ncbi:EAL domain-containing protein [Dermatophilaceae bacterium Soc4.6]
MAPKSAAVLDLVRSGGVRSVYQPIVDLDTGATVAFEALARGPHGHPLERPDRMFDSAREHGCVGELDEACQWSAITSAVAAGLGAPWSLFVNVEPAALDWAMVRTDAAAEAAGVDRQRYRVDLDLPIVVEITERDLSVDPPSLLRFVDRIRGWGGGIALDDVGAERASLALLPLLRPDVIKLDLRVVQERPGREIAEIVAAVDAEAERSGTIVLAEGIETPEHLEHARALGARLGQGWLLGRPGPLPDLSTLPAPAPGAIRVEHRAGLVREDSPFTVAAAHSDPRTARKLLLTEISKHLENEALHLGRSAVVVTALQHVRFFTPRTARRYERLADQVAFAAVLGEDVPTHPLPGVRGGPLHTGDPLLGEWDLAVLGPHFGAALVARDLGDSGPDAERRFEYVLTHDRAVAVAVAAALLSRVTG